MWCVATFMNRWFTSATLVFFFTRQVKSVRLPSGVGTRTAMPVIFPCSSGIVCVTATAAPLLVGTMFTAHALPRRRSLCGPSTWFWSPV